MKRPVIAALVALVALGLAGCASKTWDHPTSNHAQFQIDKAHCEFETRRATAGIWNDLQWAWESVQIYDLCMKAKGYYLTTRR